MYNISKLYHKLNNFTEMEYWAMKAYDYDNTRAENIYFITKFFREKGTFYKAWHYMTLGSKIKMPNDAIEPKVYTHFLFDYEKTILNYYLKQDRKESLREIIDYYNKKKIQCYSNLQFYIYPIPKISELPLPTVSLGDYTPTSTSMIRIENEYILNIRYVNYRIQPNGHYHTMVNGILTPTVSIHTRNIMVKTDLQFVPTSQFKEMTISFPSVHNTNIKGLEDVRIYDNGRKWIACSREYGYDGNNCQVIGTYDIEKCEFQDGVSIQPPEKTDGEKNWIPVGENKFIYKWHPFQIIKVEGNISTVFSEQETPHFFENMRGSTTLVEYENAYYCMIHCVQYKIPRSYFHSIVKLTKELKIESWTHPFYFNKNSIEYCIGMDMIDGNVKAIVSQFDMNPVIITIDMKVLLFYTI